MNKSYKKIVASLAISGLVLFWTSPLAFAEEDQNQEPPAQTDQSATVTDNPAAAAPDQSAVAGSTTDTVGAISGTNNDNNPSGGNVVPYQADNLDGQNNNTISGEGVPDQSMQDQNSSSGDTQDLSGGGLAATDPGSDTTGDSSSSNTDLTDNSDTTNNANIAVDSGNNKTNGNSTDGSTKTGDADIAANVVNLTNSIIDASKSLTMPILNYFSDLTGDISFDQALSIPDSLNLFQIVANLISQNNGDFSSNQNGNTQNQLALSANTGQNEASLNSGNGGVETGNANIAANVVNFLNNSIFATNWWLGMVNIFGNWAGNFVLPSQTGGNNITQSMINDLSLQNTGSVIDSVGIDANTGENQSSENSGDSNVKTGDVHVNDNRISYINNMISGDAWWMVMVNTLQGWAGAIVGAPNGSAQFIPNDSENLDSNQTEVANTAKIGNDLTLSANTGRNITNQNTGNGSIKTGSANVFSNLINFANNTFNVKNWSLGIVNVFGNWDGKIVLNGSHIVTDQALLLDGQNVANKANYEGTGNFVLNTGKNSVDQNAGDPEIVSGNISTRLFQFLQFNTAELITAATTPVIPPDNGGDPDSTSETESVDASNLSSVINLGDTLPVAGPDDLATIIFAGLFSGIALFIRSRQR